VDAEAHLFTAQLTTKDYPLTTEKHKKYLTHKVFTLRWPHNVSELIQYALSLLHKAGTALNYVASHTSHLHISNYSKNQHLPCPLLADVYLFRAEYNAKWTSVLNKASFHMEATDFISVFSLRCFHFMWVVLITMPPHLPIPAHSYYSSIVSHFPPPFCVTSFLMGWSSSRVLPFYFHVQSLHWDYPFVHP
jgi:hypothetical protein